MSRGNCSLLPPRLTDLKAWLTRDTAQANKVITESLATC